MNKLDLINKLKELNNLSIPQATKAVNLFFDEVDGALAMGDRVEIRGLCLFSVKEYKGYTGCKAKCRLQRSINSPFSLPPLV
jgi:integration host factor subunit beta